jgi:DNA-binding XRE family transcriptional regulator
MDSNQHEALSVWVRELRKRLNVSQDALADVLNVSRGAIASWEGGQRAPWEPSLTRDALRRVGEQVRMPPMPERGPRKVRGPRVTTAHDERFQEFFGTSSR